MVGEVVNQLTDKPLAKAGYLQAKSTILQSGNTTNLLKNECQHEQKQAVNDVVEVV